MSMTSLLGRYVRPGIPFGRAKAPHVRALLKEPHGRRIQRGTCQRSAFSASPIPGSLQPRIARYARKNFLSFI
jgi:hypothetical protein